MNHTNAYRMVDEQLQSDQARFPATESPHQAFGLIAEEFEDLKKAVFEDRSPEKLRHECCQIAARCIRTMMDLT